MGRENKLLSLLLREIEQSPSHTISCEHYMTQALYHPQWGYYQRDRLKVGKEGDFYTSPVVSPIFARSLGKKLLEMSRDFDQWQVVELGAGDGRLCAHLWEVWEQIGGGPQRYYLLETSKYHRCLQSDRLQPLLTSDRCQWIDQLSDVCRKEPVIVISNEFFDALPVHRVRRGERGWELGVVTKSTDGQGLAEDFCSPPTYMEKQIGAYFDLLGTTLEKGQIVEVAFSAQKWWKQITDHLTQAIVVTIDYGGEMEEVYHSGRLEGSLRCFRNHRVHRRWLTCPGESDITYDVNFTALHKWAEQLGWRRVSYESQGSFLVGAGILEEIAVTAEYQDPFCAAARERRAVMQLILPEAMGEVFKVMIHAKGC
ncbi:class I SAM-dependent methyltransferase [Mechercharimyces sp. CAU 1602]|uniref:class I SAM-dependent methyltransferase n=1 Tax=Mechercharimyces sp. CAU 1602 TaxID=2973933 RepID=UPI00216256B3|nr:SAM-dependent methyltransferase [Mechercharimyces sp. CAU 1602]MCS1350601.1 SAM-dependent methyltransferase [Mechercharimyces sp. CAU 1602]